MFFYVTIDIDQTKTPSYSAKEQSERINPLGDHHEAGELSPIGSLKTQHNSTLSERNLTEFESGNVCFEWQEKKLDLSN